MIIQKKKKNTPIHFQFISASKNNDTKKQNASMIIQHTKETKQICTCPIYFRIKQQWYEKQTSNHVLAQTQVSGDIASLSGLVNLTILYLAQTQVSGDIASISGLVIQTDFFL